MTILETGVADITGLDLGELRELPRHPLGVGTALFDPEEIVLAIAREVIAELLGDIEIGHR